VSGAVVRQPYAGVTVAELGGLLAAWQTNTSAELALKMSANWEVPKSVPFIPPVAVASRKVPRKRKTSVKVLEPVRIPWLLVTR
jgi:hypothetical protein